MTIKTLAQAIKNKKPAIIKEKGAPRYVVLDWDMYKEWQRYNGAGFVSDQTRAGEFSPTPAQKKALMRAEENLSRKKTLSYSELAKKLGITN